MEFDEEVLSNESDLYRHLIDQGYGEFETFKASKKSTSFSRHVSCSNKPIEKTEGFIKIAYYDYDNILSILNSKLLFLEDILPVEKVLSNYTIYNNKAKYFIFCGALSTCIISTAVICRKGVNALSFLGLAPLCSISVYSMCQCFKEIFKETRESKFLASYIDTLQKLCSDFHKLLRFLKETEILSTGQVSTYNISAAMYMIPASNIKDINKFPNWKTLPHSRKFLAKALVDGINLFSFAFDVAISTLPAWMNIEGFKYSSKINLQDVLRSIEDMNSVEGCISIKDLQLLTDTYLMIQSEYLKCVAFCLCPTSWKNSVTSTNKSKETMFKLFEDTQSKLSDISYNIKIHFSIQDIFLNTINVSQIKSTKSQFSEIQNIQVELHNMFLLMLSIVLRVRNLEDYLENSANTTTHCNINNTKNFLSDHLTSLRDDLVRVQKSYDEIYSQNVSKKKCDKSMQNCLIHEQTSSAKQSDSKCSTVPVTDLSSNSPDEVFLAMSGLNIGEQESCTTEWHFDSKPQIPKTLLSELSSTLETRKQEFKERERLALERVGLKDIEDKYDRPTDNENEESGSTGDSLKRRNIGHAKKKTQSKKMSRKTFSDSSLSEDESQFVQLNRRLLQETVNLKTSSNSLSDAQSALISKKPNTGGESDIETYSPVLNSSLLASVIAAKSKSWGVTSEECYSDS